MNTFNNGEPLYQAEDGGKVALEFSGEQKEMIERQYGFLNCAKCIMFCNPCFLCFYFSTPQVRNAFEEPKNMGMVCGLPRGSVRLTSQEQAPLLERWKGNWKIQPLQGEVGHGRRFTTEYTDAYITGDTVILSGGFHNSGGKRRGPVVNKPQEQKLLLFRSPDGQIYIDNIGSRLVEQSEEGELLFETAFGNKVLYQREWKRMGLTGPQIVSNADAPPAYPPPPYETVPPQKLMH